MIAYKNQAYSNQIPNLNWTKIGRYPSQETKFPVKTTTKDAIYMTWWMAFRDVPTDFHVLLYASQVWRHQNGLGVNILRPNADGHFLKKLT